MQVGKYVSRICLKVFMSLFLAMMSSSSSDNITPFVCLYASFSDFAFISKISDGAVFRWAPPLLVTLVRLCGCSVVGPKI